MSWSFQVDRTDPLQHRVEPGSGEVGLGDGEALLRVERLAVTANNVSYARAGDLFGYWRFFPASEPWGIVPAWGFATVERAQGCDVPVGQRLYGFLPMADSLVARLEQHGSALVDAAPHRAGLSPIYNGYTPVGAPEPFDDYRALLQPLLVTSFLIDGYLAGQAAFGASCVVLSSASSKTALGLAFLLRRRGLEVVGLTSPGNAAVLDGMEAYHRLVIYDALEPLDDEGPSIYVDFAGDPGLTARVHARLRNGLQKSIAVGATHWRKFGGSGPIPDPQPEFFFAPDHAKARVEAEGLATFETAFEQALADFVADSPWLTIERLHGAKGLEAAWAAAATGRADPTRGTIVEI